MLASKDGLSFMELRKVETFEATQFCFFQPLDVPLWVPSGCSHDGLSDSGLLFSLYLHQDHDDT
jgi:hypothetical protein